MKLKFLISLSLHSGFHKKDDESSYLSNGIEPRKIKRSQERAKILFEQYPQLKEAYALVCKVRAIFKMKIAREVAKEKRHAWYKEVYACTLREVKVARNAIWGKGRIRLERLLKHINQCSCRITTFKITGF